MDILKEKIDAKSFQDMKRVIFLTSTQASKVWKFEKEDDKRFLPMKKNEKEDFKFDMDNRRTCPCRVLPICL